MPKRFYLLTFLISVINYACQQQLEIEPILQKAEKLVETKPDSTLFILEKIPKPEHLKKSLYYHSFLLQIQAKDKCYRDITSDTLIFKIQKFYDKKCDTEKAALASFYSGRVRQEQKKYKEALKIYLEANKYLKQTNDDNLKGLFQGAIGEIYYQQLLRNEAITHFIQAEGYFQRAENYRNAVLTNNFIGNCFLIQEKTDSAFIYYDKAITLAYNTDLKEEQILMLENIGVAWGEIKEWDNAKEYLKKALISTEDSLKKARLCYNISNLYARQEQIDSTIFYLQDALTYLSTKKDNYLFANIYSLWSTVEERAQNFQDALDKYKLHSDYIALIFDESRNHSIIEVEKKYNYQLIENKNKQLIIERQRALLFSLIVLLISVVSILILYRHSIQNKRKLKETEQKVFQMKKLARNFNEKEKSYRNILIRHLDILKKAAVLEGYLNEDEKKKGKQLLRKFNEVVYGEKNLNWSLLYDTLNKLTDYFFVHLRNELSQLDELEFRICCLLAVDFNNTEVAIILNYSINTIHAKRSSIRKKLGIKAFGNIKEFLKTNLETQLPHLNENYSQQKVI